MSTALGLVGLVFFIAGVISLAASVTWLVVKVIPVREAAKPTESEGSTS